MDRLPFNPDRMVPPVQQGTSSLDNATKPLTVSALAVLVREALTDHFPTAVTVVGEVSNFFDRTHWFFSLKDTSATMRCVMFASSARRVQIGQGLFLEDGQQVVAMGRVDFYATSGQVQLYVERIEPVGQGVLERKFRHLCDQLRDLGYFDPEQKKSLPLVPSIVAVVTSRRSAAWQDVINTARKRWIGCRLALYDVHVQGAGAAPQVAASINSISQDGAGLGIDTIILTRGGGSIEDLWAFNERLVADAIHRCKVPIVAAIGHETNITIAELTADVRCATPTQAAMQVIPDADALWHQIQQTKQRLMTMVVRTLRAAQTRLDASVGRPLFRRPRMAMQPLGERLDHRYENLLRSQQLQLDRLRQNLVDREVALGRIEPRGQWGLAWQRTEAIAVRMAKAMANRLAIGRDRIEARGHQLEALGPKHVLRRGYSYTEDVNGQVLRQIKQVRPGDRIFTTLADGQLASLIEKSLPPGRTKSDRKRCDVVAPVRPNVKDSDEPQLFP